MTLQNGIEHTFYFNIQNKAYQPLYRAGTWSPLTK